MEGSNYTTVAAIDFGTSYSGYAFSSKSQFEEDPLNIRCNSHWGTSYRMSSIKCPKCILLNENKEFECFGYEAENDYLEICIDGNQNENYFFRGFNIPRKINRDMVFEDYNGRLLPASHVLKMYIQAFVDHLIKRMDMSKTNDKPLKVRWIIPVPSHFTYGETQFLRSCAVEAGIPSNQLNLVTEANAAFIYVKTLHDQDQKQTLKDSKEYMVVDLGGRSADITVVQKDSMQLLEKFKNSNPNCGGKSINRSFFNFLEKMLGERVMKAIRIESPDIWVDLEREFECIKKTLNIRKRNKIFITLRFNAFDQVCRSICGLNLSDVIMASEYNHDVIIRGDKMGIDSVIVRNFFEIAIQDITNQMKEVFKDYKHGHNLTDIIMVGGFTGCTLLQDALQKTFCDKNFIIPKGAEVAVIEGAVLCGHQPYQESIIPPLQGLSNSILSNLSQLNRGDFKDLVALGTFASYENKVYLAGPCNTGKSSLASILIGGKIPKTWISTDGLIIHFGRNGIDLLKRKMIPLQIGSGDVLTKLLLGHPEFKQQPGQHTAYRSRQIVDERKDHNAPMTSQSHAGNESSILMKTKRVVPRQEQKKQSTSSKKQSFDVSPEFPLEFDQKRQTRTASHIQADVLDKITNGTYVMNIAPSDLVDFGGQKSFDMTHQLFIQHKGTFILMFDGRKGLYTELEEYQPGNVTAASILEHWINSVLTYSSISDDKMPRIMFAATHSDQFSSDTKERLTRQFQEGLAKLFSSHRLHQHIMYNRVFFINATDAADIHIGFLKDTLVDIAFEQSTWGQRMPIVWVPLDLQLSDLKAEGVKLITKEALLKINKCNQEFALSERRLEDFLLVQHSIGKLLYFDEPALRDFIVIQPTAMVNILRAFITDKMFWPSEGRLRKILENVSSTGVLKKADLFALWSQPAYKDIMTDTKAYEYIVQVLLHLDILVEPKRYSGNYTASDLFLVPCMVNVNVPQQIFKHVADEQTICIAYHLKETVIPSALSFKLIGAAVSIWPLKVTDSRVCLFFQAAIMDADGRNELQIHVKGQRIVAYLINEVSKQFISPDLATTTQECLTLALERSLQFYCRCFGISEQQRQSDLFEMEVGEVCQGEICVIPLSDAKTKSHWRCKNGKSHETRSSLKWVYDKNKEHCDPNCKGLENEILLLKPNDQHFVQLAQRIGIGDFHDFFIHLGMAKSDYDNLNFRYFSNPMDFMLMGLFEWRNKADIQSTATFEKLLQALTAIKLEHYLCHVHREDHSLAEKAESRLQDVPSDHVINSLTEQTLIGDCVVHLGVELGLSIGNIKEAMFNFPRDLNGQIHAILTKWMNRNNTNRPIPTIYRLMVALKRIEAAEGLAFVKNTYNIK